MVSARTLAVWEGFSAASHSTVPERAKEPWVSALLFALTSKVWLSVTEIARWGVRDLYEEGTSTSLFLAELPYYFSAYPPARSKRKATGCGWGDAPRSGVSGGVTEFRILGPAAGDLEVAR